MMASIRQNHPEFVFLTLEEQLTQLAKDGWHQGAVKLYQDTIMRVLEMDLMDPQASQMRLWYDAHRVGSELFHKMLVAEYRPSQRNATARIAILENVLGFQVDVDNFVQMTRLGFWSERNHTSLLYYLHIDDTKHLRNYVNFAGDVARLMYAKYQVRQERFFGRPSMSMLSDVIDHQLRYYLGKPMIDFVRKQQLTKSNFIGLIHDVCGRRVRYPDAQYHNRGVADASNIKVVLHDYHLEFIFDKQDHLISLWNALEQHQQIEDDGSVRFNQDATQYTLLELQAIANTESFNYANHGGKVHDLLDGEPATRGRNFEPYLRDYAKRQF